jgi:hypothetical protein
LLKRCCTCEPREITQAAADAPSKGALNPQVFVAVGGRYWLRLAALAEMIKVCKQALGSWHLAHDQTQMLCHCVLLDVSAVQEFIPLKIAEKKQLTHDTWQYRWVQKEAARLGRLTSCLVIG